MWSLLLTKYSGDQINEDAMGGACSTYWVPRDVHTGFWWGDLRERDDLEDLDVDGMITLKMDF